MKILSIEEHDLEGLLVKYTDGINEMPYHLTKDMNGPFAKSVRLAVDESGLEVKNIKQVNKERESRQKESQELRDNFIKARKQEKEEKSKELADAILSGERQAIIEALF